MSKRALIASSGDTVSVVAIDDFVNIRKFVKDDPDITYYAIDPIYLAPTPKQVKGLSPADLKRRFDYNISKGRFLKFNGSSFVFMVPTV